MKKLLLLPILPILFICLLQPTLTRGYSITELTALYQNGQVFLSWKNANVTNLQYNVYRSLTPITLSTQLIPENFMGYVRDNSGKNIRKSLLKNSSFYFVITGNQPALSSDRGLYVVTSTASSSYYYAVTVTSLADNIEDKIIISGNSLISPVTEAVSPPQAVLQTITTQGNGDISYEYVIWGNNQNTANWRAFNNLGSYGYNFTLQKRGNSANQPLCVQFIDQGPFKKVGSDFCVDCNILSLDDWLPNGENTYWIGYHESYNMYSGNSSNPVMTTGTIKTYSQNRTQEIIRWVKRQPAIDSTRVYMYGNSHNGFGALLTAMNIPSEISSLYITAPPLIYKPKSGDKRERQLGKTTVSLPTDINYPGTTNPIQIWDFCDMRDWSRINKQGGLPFIQAINGKNDTKAGWVQKNHWYDTVNAYRQGGKWYWDQRVHNGDNALFTTLETQTDYTRYFTNKSYPAFSFCTINQNPGTGDPANGDPYGAINGYLDWDNNSIIDLNCSYGINCFIKTFYVGGVADAGQFDSCYTDITLRRTQSFHPLAGQTITWTNYDTGNNLLQSGSFVYDGKQITIAAVKIKKPGSTVSLAISNCFNRQNEVVKAEEACSLIKTTDGYTVVMKARSNQHAVLDIFDIAGHSVRQSQHELHSGNNNIHLQLPSGLYLLKVSSDEIQFTGKMIF